MHIRTHSRVSMVCQPISRLSTVVAFCCGICIAALRLPGVSHTHVSALARCTLTTTRTRQRTSCTTADTHASLPRCGTHRAACNKRWRSLVKSESFCTTLLTRCVVHEIHTYTQAFQLAHSCATLSSRSSPLIELAAFHSRAVLPRTVQCCAVLHWLCWC